MGRRWQNVSVGGGGTPKISNFGQIIRVPPKGVARIWFRGGAHPFRGGARPPIFRLRPQITRVPPYVLLATSGFRGGPGPPPPPPGYALGLSFFFLSFFTPHPEACKYGPSPCGLFWDQDFRGGATGALSATPQQRPWLRGEQGRSRCFSFSQFCWRAPAPVFLNPSPQNQC